MAGHHRPANLAMIMCVQDEEQFLAAHLAYHRHLGVERAYVYLDRCGPSTRNLLDRYPWVHAIARDYHDRHLVLHQMACADDALQRARAEGFAWLMHLDADEFALAEGVASVAAAAGSLPVMLADVPADTLQVRLGSREVVPLRGMAHQPFWKLTYFQRRGVIVRDLMDPLSGEIHRLQRWLGHDRGKSIVRTAADVQAADSHVWTVNQHCRLPRKHELPTAYQGRCHHFVVVSAAHWLAKYRKLARVDPPSWPRGKPVEFPKQCWKEASLGMTDADAERYFETWIALSRSHLEPFVRRGVVVEETLVERILTSIMPA